MFQSRTSDLKEVQRRERSIRRKDCTPFLDDSPNLSQGKGETLRIGYEAEVSVKTGLDRLISDSKMGLV